MKIFKKSIVLCFAIALTVAFSADSFARRGDSPNQDFNWGTGSNPNSHHVRSHIRQDGTFVQGHNRSNRNQTESDNWSSKGNHNPYTGKPGTRSPRW